MTLKTFHFHTFFIEQSEGGVGALPQVFNRQNQQSGASLKDEAGGIFLKPRNKSIPEQGRGKIANVSTQHEYEVQMADLKKRYSDKDFALMTKNLNRFCFPNLINCMPLIFGALQVAYFTSSDLNHVGCFVF